MTKKKHAVAVGAVLIGGLMLCGVSVSSAGTNDAVQAGLLATLQKPDVSYEQKAAACRELAHVGDKNAVPVLAGLLGDEKLGHMARYALEPIPDPSVDKALLDALVKLNGKLKTGVISSLGARRCAGAVDPLAGLLRHEDPQIACAAAGALGNMGILPAGKALLTVLDDAKGEVKLAVADGLLSAAEALAAAGKPKDALKLYEALRKSDPPVHIRLAATRGAILCDRSGGLKLLAAQLGDKDLQVFMHALGTAQDIPGDRVTPVLVDALGTLSPDRLPSLIQVLGKRRDAEALPALLRLTGAGDKPARLAALAAVVEIGKASAAPALMDLLKDPDADIAAAAAAGLASLPGAEIDKAILKRLEDKDPALRLKLVDLAGRRRIRTALPILVPMLGETNEAVRVAAIKACGELEAVSEFPLLLETLIKTSNPVEAAALEKTMGTLCSLAADKEDRSGKLAEAMSKATPVSKPVFLSLFRATGGPAALAAVRTAAGDADANFRRAAIRALSEWKTADTAPILLALAKEAGQENEKLLALRGYLGMAIRADIPRADRIGICRQAQPLIRRDDERKLLLGAAGSIGGTELLDLVLPCLDPEGTRVDAVAAVLAIAGKGGKGKIDPALRGAVEKASAVGNSAQKKQARKLLSQMGGGEKGKKK